jgi:hypothetical protein
MHQHLNRDRVQFVDLALLDGLRNEELIATNDMNREARADRWVFGFTEPFKIY